jgi:hypothetical protein
LVYCRRRMTEIDQMSMTEKTETQKCIQPLSTSRKSTKKPENKQDLLEMKFVAVRALFGRRYLSHDIEFCPWAALLYFRCRHIHCEGFPRLFLRGVRR